MKPSSTPSSIEEEIDKKIEFLFDHWAMEDKKPYTFGGWREEIVKDIATLISKSRKEVVEEFVAYIREQNTGLGVLDDDYNITSLMRHKDEFLSKQMNSMLG